MSGKNLFVELNAKLLSANHVMGLLNFIISKTIGSIKLTFCMQVHINDVILDEWVQAYPGMPKEAIKFLRTLRRYKVDFVHILCIFCDI